MNGVSYDNGIICSVSADQNIIIWDEKVAPSSVLLLLLPFPYLLYFSCCYYSFLSIRHFLFPDPLANILFSSLLLLASLCSLPLHLFIFLSFSLFFSLQTWQIKTRENPGIGSISCCSVANGSAYVGGKAGSLYALNFEVKEKRKKKKKKKRKKEKKNQTRSPNSILEYEQ